MSSETENYTIEEAQLKLAKKFFNLVWDLMDKPDRSPQDDENMIHAAHASCYLWMQVGTHLNHQRGEWQVARIYSILGHGGSALLHASRCMELTEEFPDLMTDFDLAFASESLARAYAITGNEKMAHKYMEQATSLGEAIADSADKKVFFDDYNSGPWGELK